MTERIIRDTTSVCGTCLAEVPARVVLDPPRVYLEKDCPVHHRSRVMLSENGEDYAGSDRVYHRLFNGDSPAIDRPDRYFFLTNRCNQDCTFCITEANRFPYYDDFPAERFASLLRAHRGRKASFIGGEPLLHPRVLDMAATAARQGKTLVVYTNGIRLADEQFLRDLIRAAPGLEIRMTFEGFDPGAYRHTQREDIRAVKLAALSNIERHGVATVLGCTVVEGEEPQAFARRFRAILNYSQEKTFVRGLTFQGVVAGGSASSLPADAALSVDRLMDRLLEALPYPASHRGVYLAQRCVLALARAFGSPLCEYVQPLVLIRDDAGWKTIEDFVDAERFIKRFDRRVAASPPAAPAMLATLATDLLASAKASGLRPLITQALRVLPYFLTGGTISRIPKTIFPIVVITACDRHFYDAGITRNCEKGTHTFVRGGVTDELCADLLIRHARERLAAGSKDG